MDIFHRCGEHIIMNSEYQNNNFITEFFDPKIKDHAERIKFCPGCNEPLGKMYKREGQTVVANNVNY